MKTGICIEPNLKQPILRQNQAGFNVTLPLPDVTENKETEEKHNPDTTEIGIIDEKINFHILSQDETKEYVTKSIGGS